MRQGNVPEALEIFQRYADNRPAIGVASKLHLYRGQCRWPEPVAWLDRRLPDRQPAQALYKAAVDSRASAGVMLLATPWSEGAKALR